MKVLNNTTNVHHLNAITLYNQTQTKLNSANHDKH